MKSNIYIRANDGLAPVHAAAQEGHLECLKFLLSHMGPDILSADSATPGHYAASQGHLECLKWLLTNGVITGKEVDVYKSTMAHDAAEEGHVEVLKMIYKRGFDFSVKNEDKCTPLDIAVKNQHKECINFLRNPDSLLKKTRRTNTQESALSVSSAVSSLPASASEAAGETSKNATVLEQALDAQAKVKMRKLTPIPAPVGSSVDQKWVDKFRIQGQNVKQPRIEEWVNSTLDRQEKTTLLDDDSEVDLLAPVNIDAQKRLSDDVMLMSDQTKRSELQAHLQWVSQSCENNRPGESNIGKKEKERIFSEVSKSEQRQNQIASFGIGVQETEVGNQEREKEELKRKKYRELRVKEETDRMKKQHKMVAQKKEEERKFFEEQKYKYVVGEPSHFGSQKLKKNRGIIGRLSNMLRKSTDKLSESRGQPDGADSETNSLEPFNKLGLLRSDSSNYDLYNLPTYQGKKKGREARKRESWIGSDTTFEDDIESDLDTELYMMKHKLFCTQYNSDNDSVVSYEDENLILISRPSEYTLTMDGDDDDVIKGGNKDRTSKQRSKSTKQPDYSVLNPFDIWRDSSGSETDYESFPKLTPEELLYYEQFINTAENPNCQHPLALVYLINHFLTHSTPVGRQYYLNADEEGPEPSKILFKMFKHKVRSNPVLSLDLDDAFPSDQVTPPIAFQTSDETGRRREGTKKLVDDSSNKEELVLSFI